MDGRVLFNDSASHFASCSSGADFWARIIEELARHGYKLSAGTLYPMLHDMERKGYHSVEERSGRQTRRLYRATDLGKTMLEDAREKSP